MNPMHMLSKSRGTSNLLRRIGTVLYRFGLTSNRFENMLTRYHAVTRELDCVPTLPITAKILKRHPKLIRELSNQGIDFAVHGYVHIDYSVLPLEEKVRHLNKAIKVFNCSQVPFTGFRAPFLRINGKTLEVLDNLGFNYDSSHSLNWDVIDQAKYPQQAWREYNRLLDYYTSHTAEEYLTLPRFINGLVEIPVSMPDDEAMVDRLGITDTKEIGRVWSEVLQRTYSKGELFTLQLHPERISFCESALIDVVQQAKQFNPPIWITTLGEIADWWREKGQFSLEVISEGAGKYGVKAYCTDRATLLVKKCVVNSPVIKWANGYQSINARDFVVESPARPIIGVSPDSSPVAIEFLKAEGFCVEESNQPEHYGLYLNDLARFEEADEKPLSEKIEQSDAPLLRYWRWPYQSRSTLSVTGDIDSITLSDFALRIFENWWQNRRR